MPRTHADSASHPLLPSLLSSCSWDPKETWALITWLFYAVYLHGRIYKDWTPKKTAAVSASGFVIVWICYVGVNLFGVGLHSYGFFSK